MTIQKILDKVIEYSFYAIFLLVPLAFTSATSELFELNKMWLTWALTLTIVTSWSIKMILQKKVLFQRTPLDVPIAIFLVSQIISTVFSLDPHTSFWGYYSRFNGGLLSIVSYIFLYYAFLSNFQASAIKMVKRSLFLSLISGLIVALWGLPSHFGYDPTCLIFRGTFDVSCWTADFMPKVRIFSTLGQPAWLAAYLAILIPISIAYGIKEIRDKKPETRRGWLLVTCYLLLVTLFYVDLLYTRARSGFIGIAIPLIFLFTAYFWIERKKIKFSPLISPLSFLIGLLLLITFIIGSPINQLEKFSLKGITSQFEKIQNSKQQKEQKITQEATQASKPQVAGGTDSAHIRLLVWEGAINAWKNNPIFGTGVETFAFAYYKYKPAAHNLTSESNFLYNKAHNEYLNYLATTGFFGLGTYLTMIGVFLTIVMLNLFQHLPRNGILKPASPASTRGEQVQDDKGKLLIIALLASYISILVTNFFGFSVVMTNIYLFMIPAFIFVLGNMLKTEKSAQSANLSAKIDNNESSNLYQWTGIFFIILASFFMILNLFRFWLADISFARGYNLDRAGEYQQAYPNLRKAIELRGSEPVFKDELTINNATIATSLISQTDEKNKDQAIAFASSLAQEAISLSDNIVSNYPNNVVFWKTRVKMFYTLAQIDARYLPKALEGIQKAAELAPNDANISYNLGILYGQNNNIAKGIETLETTIKLKPDYRDAHYALGLFYHTASLDETGKIVKDPSLQEKAVNQMKYILNNFSLDDPGALESLKEWDK
ncbi:MAG: O-antigen ligase family protein [Candidatus Levybacteria bacterium]|nr:O-antigen ligase family protein [Candidatus Levybacteria bacterium]